MAPDRTATPPALPEAPSSPVPTLSPLALLDPDPERFGHLVAALRADADPADPIAVVLTELLILAAGRLRVAARSQPDDAIPDLAWCRFQSLAERNFRAALKDLRRHRDRLAPPPTRSRRAAPTAPDAPEPEAPEPPPLPESTPEEVAEASSNWRRHIALVRSVSEEWPIILRLRREVEDVAARMLDGHSDETLMRWYPGLTPADIAACRACDAEGLCGPFDPADGPYPPGLPVLDDLPDPSS